MDDEARSGGEMSFWDHLEELRWTVLRSAIAVCVFCAAGLAFKGPLFDVVLWPSQPDFIVYKWLGWNLDMSLINVEISAQFFTHLKAALAAGVVLAFPYIIFEIWKFIAPALYEREKKAVGAAFAMSSFFFYLGVVVGYFFVLPVCLQFFMNYTVSPDISNTITLSSYMSMFTSMSLLIGIVFEFPTVISVLSRLGVVTRGTLRKGRKYAFLAVLLLAALITPSDPFSMLVLAFPLYLLYELSILMCRKEVKEDDID
ncbi:MAG: twin-arginine translocase subunit TatC [Bacteroidales bacterium]|nr:twin-arginine translocase subunit TatC [Bacteroidales bacterium]